MAQRSLPLNLAKWEAAIVTSAVLNIFRGEVVPETRPLVPGVSPVSGVRSRVDSIDTALVERARTGDRYALDQLVRQATPGVYRFVRRLVQQEEDARDITQEVFLRMVRHMDRYDPSFRFETWLFRIARNLCFDRGRRTQRWRFAFWTKDDDDDDRDPLDTMASTDPGALDITLGKETSREIEQALTQIKPAYREILVLYHFEEMSYQEIASVLALPMGTVMNRLFRARQAMKEVLNLT